MYYNMPINSDLIRLWQLEQALHNLGGSGARGFSEKTYDVLRDNLLAEIKMLGKSINLTVETLTARSGTLIP